MIAIEATEIVKDYRTYRKPRNWLVEKLSLGAISRARIIRALDQVSISVDQGESFGIIGPNGSGKTTLLKVITDLVQPTSGNINVPGRVAAFLELGSGFHPDFTGRRNVQLNCAIMGVPPSETRRLVDEVVAFSELGEAVDDPVRTYSSGMFMRLGFSVAVAIDPEIMVVDEVLSVGDEYFMGKCVERLNDFKRRGRTIVMVSHDLALVRRLCDRVVLLRNGRVTAEGRPDEVADTYLKQVYEEAAGRLQATGGDIRSLRGDGVRRGSGEIEITRVEIIGPDEKPARVIETARPFTIEMEYVTHKPVERALFGFNIFRSDGVLLVSTNHELSELSVDHPPLLQGSTGRAVFRCESLSLLGGDYSLGVSIFRGDEAVPVPIDEVLGAAQFKVFAANHRDKGNLLLPGKWEFLSDEVKKE